MNWQTITVAGFIVLVVVLVFYFSVKETRPVSVLEQPLTSGEYNPVEVIAGFQEELKNINAVIQNIQFEQLKLNDKVSSLQMARGIENEQIKYLTQNAQVSASSSTS